MKIAVISDIHEDIVNLKVALKKIEKFKADEIICLGDISGFSIPYYHHLNSRNAHECISLIKSTCKTVVLGNHDMHAAKILPKHCNFFKYPDNWYELNYQQKKEIAKNIIWLHEENDLDPLYTENDLQYLKTLPEYFIYKTPKINILFTHYAYPNISGLKKEFFTYTDEFFNHFNFMDINNCTISFIGHTHIQGLLMVSRKKINSLRFGEVNLKSKPSCLGIPSIALNKKKNGFCIFDIDKMVVNTIKI